MKKILGVLFASSLICAGLFAYNPPAGGQNVLRLTEPQLITGAHSAAGGGIFGVTPAQEEDVHPDARDRNDEQ